MGCGTRLAMTGLFRYWSAPLRAAMATAALWAAAGCAYVQPSNMPLTRQQAEELTPLVPVPASRAWISPDGLQLVFHRDLPGGAEQRVLLANHTPVAGDNQMVLRIRQTYGEAGRLRFEDFVHRIGGLPAPFEAFSPGSFIDGEDDLGPYSWAEERVGAEIICVLAVRRLATGRRHLPAQADAMDILLRNCVVGSADQALSPILAPSVMGSPQGTASAGQPRMLSALAGPSQ